MREFFKNSTNFRKLAFLIFIFLIITILVKPFGEFAVYDDWSFARSVKNFLDTGEFRFCGWTSMPLLTNVLWGSLFASIFGFSFTVLKISTIVSAVVCIIVTFYFFRELTNNDKASFWLTVVFSIQAVFLNFVYSFNTDILFHTLIIITSLLFLKFIKSNNFSLYLLGIIFLLAAVLSRDTGIVIAFAFLTAMIAARKVSFSTVILGLIPLLLSIAAILLWRSYLESIDAVPALYDLGRERMTKIFDLNIIKAIIYLAKNIVWLIIYLGVFLSPLIFLFQDKINRLFKDSKVFIFLTIIASLTILTAGFNYSSIAGKYTEILIHHIFSAALIENVHDITNRTLVERNSFWDVFASVLAGIGFFLMVSTIFIILKNFFISVRQEISANYKEIFSISAIIVYIVPIIMANIFMKYLIFVFPFAIYLIYRYLLLSTYSSLSKKFAFVSGIFILYFSVATTHDMLQENKYKWQLANKLTEEYNIPPEKIDAGITYSGWHLYDPNYKTTKDKNWWWIRDDEYIVVDGKIKGCEVLFKDGYYKYLPPFHKVRFYALKEK